MAAGPIKFSADDHIVYVDGIPVGHYTSGEIQPDTGSRVTPFEAAEGILGNNVAPSAKSRPGSGSFGVFGTSPDLVRLAEKSAEAETVSVSIKVVKNFSAYAYKEVGLTHATLGPVPVGFGKEAPERQITFQGSGFYINARDTT